MWKRVLPSIICILPNHRSIVTPKAIALHTIVQFPSLHSGPILVRIEQVKMEESISSDTATQMSKCCIEEATILHETKDRSFGLERRRVPESEMNRKEKTFSDLETSIVGKWTEPVYHTVTYICPVSLWTSIRSAKFRLNQQKLFIQVSQYHCPRPCQMMANPSAFDTPSPPHVMALPPTEVHQLVRFLHDRNRLLTVENERLLEEYETLEKDVIHNEALVSWQHRLVSLGEEHIKLLETIIQVQREGGSQSTPLPIDERIEFQPQTFSSPLNTPPELLPQSRQIPVTEVPKDEERRTINQDDQIVWPRHGQGHGSEDEGHPTSFY